MMRVLLLLAALTAGCYRQQRIPLAELEQLTAAPGRPPAVDVPGEDCDGCSVTVDTTTPILLTDADGRTHRVTPFYFHMSDAQLVSPDYGVLLDRTDLQQAEVRHLSTGGTLTLVGLVTAAAVGTFLAIQLTSGEQSFSN